MTSLQLDEDEMRTWLAFLRLWRAMTSGMERQLTAAGSSGAEYQVLVTLAEAPSRALRPRDIGGELGWDRSHVSHQIRRMEQRGLVERRRRRQADARAIQVRLTDRGMEALKAAAPGHIAWVRRHFIDKLSAADAATLRRISAKVLADIPSGPEQQEASG